MSITKCDIKIVRWYGDNHCLEVEYLDNLLLNKNTENKTDEIKSTYTLMFLPNVENNLDRGRFERYSSNLSDNSICFLAKDAARRFRHSLECINDYIQCKWNFDIFYDLENSSFLIKFYFEDNISAILMKLLVNFDECY